MVCQKPTLTHCRAQTNVHNSCVPRTWRRQASGQITRSAVPGIATRFPFFANRKIRNGRTFSRRASTHALTLQANGLYNESTWFIIFLWQSQRNYCTMNTLKRHNACVILIDNLSVSVPRKIEEKYRIITHTHTESERQIDGLVQDCIVVSITLISNLQHCMN